MLSRRDGCAKGCRKRRQWPRLGNSDGKMKVNYFSLLTKSSQKIVNYLGKCQMGICYPKRSYQQQSRFWILPSECGGDGNAIYSTLAPKKGEYCNSWRNL